MHVLKVRNVHQALPEVMYLLATQGHNRHSRNGRVRKIPGPVTIEYAKPMERVIFWPERDANPFFHVLEALWMLAGRNDVEFVASIVPMMATFSDDGEILNSAYGHRWRHHFGYDQLLKIAEALANNRDDRRQVLSMWDHLDLGSDSKDLPCNTHIYFSRTDTGALDMMVTNRSNDAVWGALGANAVHFSMLQEYMAVMIGCSVGKYWQVTNNLHLYLDKHEKFMYSMADKAFPSDQYRNTCPYESGRVQALRLIPSKAVAKFDADVAMFLDDGMTLGMNDWFVRKIANYMMGAIRVYKEGKADRVSGALELLYNMPPESDWRLAGEEWLRRREK